MKTTLKNESLSATILHKGAELESLIKNGKNYIWTIDEKYWNKTSPVLFPIVGCLKNNSYTHENQQYTLPRHGFARDQIFQIINQATDSVTFSLKATKSSFLVYPFDFELQLQYRLTESQLTINYLVINNSNSSMPFALGAHPAFAIDGNITDYSLLFDNADTLLTHRIKHDLFSGETNIIPLDNNTLHLSYDLFSQDAIVLKNNSSKVLTLTKSEKPYFKISFPAFPSLGIWTKEFAPFLCIEPWQGFADNNNTTGEFSKKEGMQVLENKKQIEYSIEIELF